MFPFNRFFGSFSPFFLAKTKNTLTIGKSILYYLSIWFLGIGLIAITILITGWIYVTPTVVSPLLDRVPPFDAVMENGLLVKTSLPSDPFEYDMEGFHLFVSSALTEIPKDKIGIPGAFILRDHAVIQQTENMVNKSQSVIYAETPELKNIQINNTIVKTKIIGELPAIKKALAFVIVFFLIFVTGIVSLWYLIFSFFWALIVFLFSKLSRKHRLTYEQSLSFVLSTFFPVVLVSLALMISGFYVPFLMTTLFLGMFGYNHLSYYSSENVD